MAHIDPETGAIYTTEACLTTPLCHHNGIAYPSDCLQMSDLASPVPTRPSDGRSEGTGGATVSEVAAQQAPRVAELAGESASPPPATFTAVINIKCPDQTGVVRENGLGGDRAWVRLLWLRGETVGCDELPRVPG